MRRKMQNESKIVLHTKSTNLGLEAITYEVTLWKVLVAEFNTHKAEIERNSASSRAVPTRKIIDMVVTEPAFPSDWRYNESGMAASLVMNDEDAQVMDDFWL